jgi:K+-transporting ATPase ATPase A chain
MRTLDLFGLAVFVAVLLATAAPLGRYMAAVFEGKRTFLEPVARPLERFVLRLVGSGAGREMGWKEYALALLTFNALGILFLYVVLRLQAHLPLNPQDLGAVPGLLALNTAVSFVTNTNWQAYAGEVTLSHLSQMTGLTVQNFLSAATGMAVAVALARGLASRRSSTVGNFWVDAIRAVVWVLLPLSLVFSLVLAGQGVVQNLGPAQIVQTLEGGRQTLAMGPAASQEAIKLIGTNGGGFFGANAAHPFENPTPLTNFLECLSILLVPAGMVFAFGHLVRDRRQGRAILAAMLVLFALFLGTAYAAESAGNPLLQAAGAAGQGSLEGKEVRFGVGGSALYATVTTAASCGSVNASHDSLTPLGGFVAMVQIMVGEVVFGGVGSGLYGMLMFVILTVFIIGLMVGRTPEYLGKKVEAWEMKMAVLAVLIPSAAMLGGAAVAVATGAGTAPLLHAGPHGLSEVLYAFASSAGNNGSAFGGLAANTVFYNVATSLAMLIGRFGVILPVLALAGRMGPKWTLAQGPGTFPTHGWLFGGLLAAVVLVVGALTFLPALALGPLLEHLLMVSGRLG